MFRASGMPDEIASGPGHTIWFTEFRGNAVGEITPQGTVKTFAVGSDGANGPTGIVAGPLGEMWFSCGLCIAGITTAGAVSVNSYGGFDYGATGYQDIAAMAGQIYFVADFGSGASGWQLDTENPVTGAQTAVAALPAGTTADQVSAYGGYVWLSDNGGVESGRVIGPSLLRISPGGQERSFRLTRAQLGATFALAGGSAWLPETVTLAARGCPAAARTLVRLDPVTGRRKLYRIPLPAPSGHVLYCPRALQVAADARGDVWFAGGDQLVGERTRAGSYRYWRTPYGATEGMAVDGSTAYVIVGSEIVALR
ncbi:MAG: hypothetical protein M0T77_01600 [Actinomycetota bacterium]|nr:hypothetical protein [Actinomycetota bacterium]